MITGLIHPLPTPTSRDGITSHNEASVHKDPGIGRSVDHGITGGALCYRHILILKPGDYIGLYLMVIFTTVIAVNWLYRIHF